MVLQGHVTNENYYISNIRMPMATKLGRMVTYIDGLLPEKSCKVKNIIPAKRKTYLCLWLPNLARCYIQWRVPTYKVAKYLNQVVLWFYVTYKYFISLLALDQWPSNMWQGGDSPWEASTHKSTSPFKACVRYFYQIFIFSPNDSPSKTVKNVFYFI